MNTELIRAAVQKAHATGRQHALDAMFANLGRTLASQLLPSLTALPAVTKAADIHSTAEPEADEDPHAALLLAQLDHLIQCAESGRDHRPGDKLLHSLWSNPSGLAHVLQSALHSEPVSVQKAVAFALFLKAAERAPKGGITLTNHTSGETSFYPGGRWIPASVVAAASPESKQELSERNAGVKPNPLSKREKASAASAERRGTREAVRKHIADIGWHILRKPAERTPDAYRDLAAAVTQAVADGHLRVEDLRALRMKLSASFGGARRKEQMVSALLDYVNLTAKDAQEEIDHPTPPPVRTPRARPEPKPGDFAVMSTDSLSVDPARFQFKIKVNEAGVTKELENVKQFNPDFAGVIAVWFDPVAKKTFVINGHHRYELARRTGYPHLAVRYIDAKDAREARAKGALINIAEGRGTALDAAKFLRDSGRSAEDLFTHGVSREGSLVRDAENLTRLNDAAFDRVARGALDQSTAIAVAKHLTDPDRQEKLFKLIARREEDGKDFTNRHLEEMARQMAAAPSITTDDSDDDGVLFKVGPEEHDVFLERSELASHIRGELSKEHHDYGALASERRASATAEAGNVLNTAENKQRAEHAEVHRHAFDTLAYRKGAIADALDQGAVALKTAKTKKEKESVRKQTLNAVRTALASAVAGQATDGGGVGGVVPGGDPGSGVEPGASGGGGAGQVAADGDRTGDGAAGVSRLSATSPALASASPNPSSPNASWIPGGMTPHAPRPSPASATSPALAGSPNGKPAPGGWIPGASTPHVREEESPPNFGDWVTDTDGTVGKMQGSGGMGSGRVKLVSKHGTFLRWATRADLKRADEPSSPNEPSPLDTLAASAIPRKELQKTHRNLMKYSDLHPQGYTISHWMNPSEPLDQVLEYNPRLSDKPRLTARNGDELKAIHDALGIPVPPPREKRAGTGLDANGMIVRSRGNQKGVVDRAAEDEDARNKSAPPTTADGELPTVAEVAANPAAKPRPAGAAKRLREHADKIAGAAQSELGRDRQTNTRKRAEQAGHAVRHANNEQAFSETIHRLANSLEDGTAQHLSGVKNGAQVRSLDLVLARAMRSRDNALGERTNWQDGNSRDPHPDDADHATYPHPFFDHADVRRMADEVEANPAGEKLALPLRQLADRLERAGAANGGRDGGYVTNPEDIAALAEVAKEKLSPRYGDLIKSKLEDANRLASAGIHTQESLRNALREYIPLKSKPKPETAVQKAERALIGRKIPGYFATPDPLVHQMVDRADIQPGHSVLEPSAGKGSILDAIKSRHPDASAEGIEPNSELRTILEHKGHKLVGTDFLQHQGQHDRILMNPPFENGQDIDHVRHAFDRLKPGGKLVSIMSEGPFFRSDKKSAEFREWLDANGGDHEKLPPGSFGSSGTGVNTRMVTLGKPAAKETFSPNATTTPLSVADVTANPAAPLDATLPVGKMSPQGDSPPSAESNVSKPTSTPESGHKVVKIAAGESYTLDTGETKKRQGYPVFAVVDADGNVVTAKGKSKTPHMYVRKHAAESAMRSVREKSAAPADASASGSGIEDVTDVNGVKVGKQTKYAAKGKYAALDDAGKPVGPYRDTPEQAAADHQANTAAAANANQNHQERESLKAKGELTTAEAEKIAGGKRITKTNAVLLVRSITGQTHEDARKAVQKLRMAGETSGGATLYDSGDVLRAAGKTVSDKPTSPSTDSATSPANAPAPPNSSSPNGNWMPGGSTPRKPEPEAAPAEPDMTPDEQKEVDETLAKMRDDNARGGPVSALGAPLGVRPGSSNREVAIPTPTAPGVNPDHIPLKMAQNAYYASSFSPERRGKQEQADYVNQMNADYEHLSQYADTPEKQEQLREEFERYRAGYVKHQLARLHATSRTMSSMITGPSKFPTERNQKRLDTEHKRSTEHIEFRERALKAIRKKLRPETGAIQSNDPNAASSLEKKLASLKALQDQYKAINNAHKKFLSDPASLDASDLSDEHKAAVRNYKSQYSWEPHPIAPYQLTNNAANIRRVQSRIEELKKLDKAEAKSENWSGGVTVEESPEDARIRIHFPGKPSREVIDSLKGRGFRWSPSVGAWQRHLNGNGRYAVESVLKQHGHTKEAAEAAPAAADTTSSPNEDEAVPPPVEASAEQPEPEVEEALGKKDSAAPATVAAAEADQADAKPDRLVSALPSAASAPARLPHGTGTIEAEEHAYAKHEATAITATPDMPDSAAHAAAASLEHDWRTAHSRDHSHAIRAIPKGDSRFIAGHRVRHTAEGKFQVERRGGFLASSSPNEISDHIRGAWDKQQGYKSIPKAIDRAQSYAEPDPFTEPDAAALDAAARSAIPQGSAALSLDPNTYGRIGYVKHDEETGTTWLALEGGEETKATDFEPISESQSWRGESGKGRKEADAIRAKGGKAKKREEASLFGGDDDEEGGAPKKPLSQAGMFRAESERAKREVAAARERAKAEPPKYYSATRRIGDVKEGPSLGAFLTQNEHVAHVYSDGKGDYRTVAADIQKPLTIAPVDPDPEFHEMFSPSHVNDALKKAGVKFQFPDDNDEQEFWRYLDQGGKKLTNAIQKAGYDSLVFPDVQGNRKDTSTLVFDKDKLKNHPSA